MATYTIDEIAITRTASNIDDNDVFELQIKDGSSDDLKSAKITKLELQKLMNDGSTPLRYKALLSQNAPVATTQNPTIIAGQIWEDTIGTANAGDLAILGSYELISGSLGAVNAKYRSGTDDTPSFTTSSLSYDGSPYIVSTDSNGDFNPSVNTLGGNPTYSYDSTGIFYAELTGVFVETKTYPRFSVTTTDRQFVAFVDSSDFISISTKIIGGAKVNDVLYYTPFEIEVYP